MTPTSGLDDSGDRTAVRYRTTTVDGLNIFYREAGDRRHPVPCSCTGFRRRR